MYSAHTSMFSAVWGCNALKKCKINSWAHTYFTFLMKRFLQQFDDNSHFCMTKIQQHFFITDQGIDEESFYCLDDQDIVNLMPKVGPRSKFKTRLKLLKVMFCTVKIHKYCIWSQKSHLCRLERVCRCYNRAPTQCRYYTKWWLFWPMTWVYEHTWPPWPA